jgi:ankyrin repeat protein
MSEYSFGLQQRVLEELKALATSPTASYEIRAHAAMTVSECYATAFGTTYSNTDVLRWLEIASLEGHTKASRWYNRVHEAISPPSGVVKQINIRPSTAVEGVADELSIPTELYLTNRIRLENTNFVNHIRDDLTRAGQPYPDKFAGIQLHTDPLVSDDLLPLHVAALLGDDMMIAEILCNNDIGDLSAAGFTVAHYACVGGHLSTLRLVLERGANVSSHSIQHITPLHLSIFFASADIQDAVHLLIAHGAITDISSDRVELKAHDIVLEKRPLEWAVITRNSTLVNALLPHSKHHVGIQYALSHYYYEIASDLLSDDTRRAVLPPGYRKISFAILRPFRHWIAHGDDGASAIQRTIELCARFGLVDCSRALQLTLYGARAQPNIKVLEALLKVYPRSAVRHGFKESMSVLHSSLHIFRNNPAWDHILRLIVSNFSVAELSEHVFDDGSYNFLHLAICYRHVSYMRILLEKGVSANSLTEGPVRVSPLELCIVASSTSSREMWTTLLEYGYRGLEEPYCHAHVTSHIACRI